MGFFFAPFCVLFSAALAIGEPVTSPLGNSARCLGKRSPPACGIRVDTCKVHVTSFLRASNTIVCVKLRKRFRCVFIVFVRSY